MPSFDLSIFDTDWNVKFRRLWKYLYSFSSAQIMPSIHRKWEEDKSGEEFQLRFLEPIILILITLLLGHNSSSLGRVFMKQSVGPA